MNTVIHSTSNFSFEIFEKKKVKTFKFIKGQMVVQERLLFPNKITRIPDGWIDIDYVEDNVPKNMEYINFMILEDYPRIYTLDNVADEHKEITEDLIEKYCSINDSNFIKDWWNKNKWQTGCLEFETDKFGLIDKIHIYQVPYVKAYCPNCVLDMWPKDNTNIDAFAKDVCFQFGNSSFVKIINNEIIFLDKNGDEVLW